MKLTQRRCEPCRAGTPPLSQANAEALHREVPEWSLKDDVIEKTFKWKDFREAMRFVNQVASVAEENDHHPAIHISYNKVRLELTTHKIGGLSENDFILAARIDELVTAGT